MRSSEASEKALAIRRTPRENREFKCRARSTPRSTASCSRGSLTHTQACTQLKALNARRSTSRAYTQTWLSVAVQRPTPCWHEARQAALHCSEPHLLLLLLQQHRRRQAARAAAHDQLRRHRLRLHRCIVRFYLRNPTASVRRTTFHLWRNCNGSASICTNCDATRAWRYERVWMAMKLQTWLACLEAQPWLDQARNAS